MTPSINSSGIQSTSPQITYRRLNFTPLLPPSAPISIKPNPSQSHQKNKDLTEKKITVVATPIFSDKNQEASSQTRSASNFQAILELLRESEKSSSAWDEMPLILMQNGQTEETSEKENLPQGPNNTSEQIDSLDIHGKLANKWKLPSQIFTHQEKKSIKTTEEFYEKQSTDGSYFKKMASYKKDEIEDKFRRLEKEDL